MNWDKGEGCLLLARFSVLCPLFSSSLPCSRGWGLCLDDAPTKDVIDFPSVPPGVLYDVGHQCRLQYGAYSAFCEDMDVSVGWAWGGGCLPSPQQPLA